MEKISTENLDILKASELFKGLSSGDICEILNCTGAYMKKYNKGEYILLAGSTTEFMGMLLSGSATVVQEDIWGNQNILSKIIPGLCFAEPFAACPGVILNISVIAESNSSILWINMKNLLHACFACCSHHNKVIRNLVVVLAGKLLIFNDKITHTGKRKIREKLLSYLYTESVRQGKLSFDIPYDRQQLADFLCVGRSAMSMELSKLQREGLIKTSHNHFELLGSRDYPLS